MYVRTAVDKYNNWQPIPTFPSFAGQKLGSGDDDDPAAKYQLVSYGSAYRTFQAEDCWQTFQYTVYAYQEGIMFTIGQHDNEKNQSVATLNSKKLSVVASCNARNDSIVDEESSSSGAAAAKASTSEQPAESTAWRAYSPLSACLTVVALSALLTIIPL